MAKRPCAATCTASPETELLCCSPQLLREFVGHETFLRNYARIAYDMLAHDNAFKAIDQFYTAEQKICSYLIKFAEPSGTFTQNQSYLANAAGCTRQTVNKELSYLREQDIIQIERNEISILDATRLQERIAYLDSRKAKKF
jgi:CRP-like cAMP-binding protein